MALFHRATVTPSKLELISAWAHTRPWGPAAGTDVEAIGSYRFDDPEGRVGMETHLVVAGGVVLQVPLTYRDAPLAGADAALVGTTEHSVLGTRWVYDGLRDPRFALVLAGVALTGQGEALGLVELGGRWHIAPSDVRIQGGGWTLERAAVDGFEVVREDEEVTVLCNDRFEMAVHRRPAPGDRPAVGLTATWEAQPSPVVLVAVDERPG